MAIGRARTCAHGKANRFRLCQSSLPKAWPGMARATSRMHRKANSLKKTTGLHIHGLERRATLPKRAREGFPKATLHNIPYECRDIYAFFHGLPDVKHADSVNGISFGKSRRQIFSRRNALACPRASASARPFGLHTPSSPLPEIPY